MIVLVPLPLSSSMPGMGDPGIMIVCGNPGVPLTRPGPREVVALDGAVMGEGGADSDADGGACAAAVPISAVTAAAVTKEIFTISCSPEGVRREDRANRASMPGTKTRPWSVWAIAACVAPA